jgi:fumarate reductase flavoprotein subunit
MSTDAKSVSHPDYHNGVKDDFADVAVGACNTPIRIEHAETNSTSPVASPVIASSTMTGFGGNVTVTLTVLEGRITDCRICGDNETPDTGGRAIKAMQTRLIEAGTSKVDGVCGATATSRAILRATAKAYNEAVGVKAGEVKMMPGKYTASATGHSGVWKLPVTITVNEKALLKIETPTDRFAHGETEVIFQSVKDKLFPRIIENQSVNVDAIAGATVSSNAVKHAVESALKEALAEGESDESAIEHFYQTQLKVEKGDTEVIDTDLLVVGMSTGGILAMRSAMDTMKSLNGNKRVSILAIDKAGKYGGKSALTHEMASVNPREYQNAVNNGDDFIDAERFLKEWLDYTTNNGVQSAKEVMIRLFFEESGKTIDWIYNQGWLFGTAKKSDMTDGYTAFNTALTSNVDIGTYEDRRSILDTYYKYLIASVVAQGGNYILETEAYELIMDGDRAKGVKARNNVTGKEYVINAKAVIISTGGFGSNDRMMTEVIDPRWAGPRKQLGTGMDDGKMIKAALDVGAGTWNIDMSPLVMHFSLPHRLTRYPIMIREGTLDGRTGRSATWTLNDLPLGLGISADAILVNKEGSRFCDESIVGRFASEPSMDSWCGSAAGQYYYAIYSKDQLDVIAKVGLNNIPRWEGYCSQGGVPKDIPIPVVYDCLDICVEEGMAWKGRSLHDLATQLGMEPDSLVNTVNSYNSFCVAGVDEQFGKPSKFLTGVGSGPYYAIKIMCVSFATSGGLDVDTQIRVLKSDHKTPIYGLYAIGNDSLGVLLNRERNYIGFGGVAQGWLTTSGRLAGINATKYISEIFGLADVKPALVNISSEIS